LKNKIYLIFLGIFSLTINQFFANKGVFPIDSFLIFDPAFYITSGYHPFKDYWLITGPFLDYIQSLFFLIFGISWFSYALHASVVNMAIALFSFHFLINIGLKNYYALLYSLGVSILAYPPIGTPFIDHHSVIFSVMALYSFSLGILRKKNIFLFFTPFFLVISFFSKQIPSPHLLVLFIIFTFICFFFTKSLNKKNLIYLIFGSLFCFLLIFVIFAINQIPINNFLIQYIFYPLSLGVERIDKLSIDFKNTITQFKFIYFALIPLAFCGLILFIKKRKNLIEINDTIISFLFLFSAGIFIYCQLLTKNQILIFFLIPIFLGCSHAYILKYLNKKYIVYLILIVFVFSLTKYHLRFNHNKKFMELVNANFDLAVNASQIDSRFGKLRWITPDYMKNPNEEIRLLVEVKNILSEEKEKKIIVTDYQFFSSFLKNDYPSPNKWYDRLSVPSDKSKYYPIYRDFFLRKLNNNKIKHIFFIGKNKHNMSFFRELSYKNKCIIPRKINGLLTEFDINQCEKVF